MPDRAVSPQSTPTRSGLILPSGVGPRLLYPSIVSVLSQCVAPMASMPGLALSAGLVMLPPPVDPTIEPFHSTTCIQRGRSPVRLVIWMYALSSVAGKAISYGRLPALPSCGFRLWARGSPVASKRCRSRSVASAPQSPSQRSCTMVDWLMLRSRRSRAASNSSRLSASVSAGTPSQEEWPLLPALFTQRMSLLTAFASVLRGALFLRGRAVPGPVEDPCQGHVYDRDVLCDHPNQRRRRDRRVSGLTRDTALPRARYR